MKDYQLPEGVSKEIFSHVFPIAKIILKYCLGSNMKLDKGIIHFAAPALFSFEDQTHLPEADIKMLEFYAEQDGFFGCKNEIFGKLGSILDGLEFLNKIEIYKNGIPKLGINIPFYKIHDSQITNDEYKFNLTK